MCRHAPSIQYLEVEFKLQQRVVLVETHKTASINVDPNIVSFRVSIDIPRANMY